MAVNIKPPDWKRCRFAGAIIAPQTLWNAVERKPAATRRPARNAMAGIRQTGYPSALPINPRRAPSPLPPRLDPAAPPATSASATTRVPIPAANRNSDAAPTRPAPSTCWTPAPRSTAWRPSPTTPRYPAGCYPPGSPTPRHRRRKRRALYYAGRNRLPGSSTSDARYREQRGHTPFHAGPNRSALPPQRRCHHATCRLVTRAGE